MEEVEVIPEDIKKVRKIEKGYELELKHKIESAKNVSYSLLSSFPQYEVLVEKLVAEPTLIEDEIFLRFRKTCKIYKVCLGVNSQYVFLVTKEKKELGVQSLSLKKIDFEELQEVLEGAELPSPKIFGIKEDSLSWSSIIKDNLVRFYKELEPIPFLACLAFAKRYGLNNLLEDFLCENASIDEDLKLIFKSQLLTYGSLKPELQRYSPHSLIITNTKVGKSYVGRKICPLAFDSATSSNLLGFSTAEKIVKGSIDEEYKPVLLDDFSTAAYPEAFLDALPTLLEQGESRIGKGKQAILTRSSSSFILTTNTARKTKPYDLMLEFSKIVAGLSKMMERIGSRFACIYFNPQAKEVSNGEYRLSKRDIQINKMVVEILFKHFSRLFARLFDIEEVERWLNTPIPEYSEKIKILCERGALIPEVSEFWISHASGYRHIRGMALRLGFIEWLSESLEKLENIEEFEFTEEMIKEIIKSSEDFLTQIIQLNLNSLKRFVDISQDLSEFYKMEYESLKQGYLKVLIAAFVCHLKDDPESRIVLIDSLEEYVKKVATVLGNGLERYKFISKVKEKIQNIKKVNSIISTFGVEIFEEKGSLYLKVENYDVVKQLEFLTDLKNLGKLGKMVKSEEELKNFSSSDYTVNKSLNFKENKPETQKFEENFTNFPIFPESEKATSPSCYFCKLPKRPLYNFAESLGRKDKINEGWVCFSCAVEKLLPTPFKIFGSGKIPKSELEIFPKDFIERCFKEGILVDLGEIVLLIKEHPEK